MTVAAVCQFYFPYVLPRAPDWEGNGLAFQLPSVQVRVRGRSLNEDLFPAEIDVTLSSMVASLSRLSLPVSTITRTVRDISCDRVECLVISEVVSLQEVMDRDVQSAYRNAAIRVCNLFLDHCRVVARSPFVTGVEVHYRLQDASYHVITPHTIRWITFPSEERIPAYSGGVNAMASSGAIAAPERGGASFAEIRDALANGASPDLAVGLLLDAKERLVTLRLREAVIAIASACEIASDRFIERKGQRQIRAIELILRDRSLSFAHKRFDSIPQLVSMRSLLQEDPDSFEQITHAYRARNNLAHAGELSYEQAGISVEVDAPVATKFLYAGEQAVSWLESL